MSMDGAMCEKPLSGVDNAMGRMENEVNEIELQVGNLIEQLHSVIMPEGPSPCAPDGPSTMTPPPSPVTNNLNAMSTRLAALSGTVRMARERLDV